MKPHECRVCHRSTDLGNHGLSPDDRKNLPFYVVCSSCRKPMSVLCIIDQSQRRFWVACRCSKDKRAGFEKVA